MESQFLRIAQQLLEKEGRPMTPKQLVDRALNEKLFSDKFIGKTLDRTMSSKLSVHIRKNGDASPFVRTDRGHFYLRSLLNGNRKIYLAPPSHLRGTEYVLVFPSSWLDRSNRFQGIKRNRRNWKHLSRSIINDSGCKYIERLKAENNEDYKQILTYILVTRGKQILAFKRGTFNRVEDYLRGAHCVGFGGHVSDVDHSLFNPNNDLGILDNAIRELSEELKLPAKDKQRLRNYEGLETIGLLNDDSSPVGRRHFAFILRYEVSDDPSWERPERGEKAITQLRWLDLNHPSSFFLRDFEYWSQLCLRTYYQDLVRLQPSFIIRRKRPLVPPHLLCVLGEVGSGKSEATNVLKEEFGYTEINTGRVLAEILGIPPVPTTDRSVFQKEAWKFISRANGPKRLAKAVWENIRDNPSPRILIDGIRQPATLDELRHLTTNRRVGLLFVHTPPDLAYQFYRKRTGRAYSIHDFLRLREAPVEREVQSMIGLSDAVLYNWTGREMYKTTIRKLMQEISK